MRVIGLFLAGVLISTTPMVAHAVPLGSDIKHVGTMGAAGIIKVWDGCGWGWHLVPGHWSQWRGGWVPPHCAPNRYYGAWVPSGGWEAPYWGWRPYGGRQGSYEGRGDTGGGS